MTRPREGSRGGQRVAAGVRVHQILFGGLGGHSSVGLSLIRATPLLRHSVTFFGTEPPLPELTQVCHQLDVEWSGVCKAPGFDATSLQALAGDLRMHQPDAVLVHSPSTLPAVLPYCLRAGVPLVVVDHTPTDAKERREWLALGLGLVFADATVFLTPRAEADALARFGRLVRPSRCRVIPNGIDVERFSPGAPLARGPLTLSMLSRFAPLRDHFSLVEAVALVLARMPELSGQLRVVLAGDGPTLPKVRQRAHELGLDQVVELPGLLNEDGVLALLRSSDLYVHSSLAETMSTSVMQALAVGVPTIATRIPGMDFLVDHGQTGLLVAPRDVSALAEAIVALLADRVRATALGTAARAEAVARFSSSTMAAGYESLIAELLEGA